MGVHLIQHQHQPSNMLMETCWFLFTMQDVFSGRSDRAVHVLNQWQLFTNFLFALWTLFMDVVLDIVLHFMARTFPDDLPHSHSPLHLEAATCSWPGAVLEALEAPGNPGEAFRHPNPNPSLWDSSEVKLSHLPNRESTCLPRLPTETRGANDIGLA